MRKKQDEQREAAKRVNGRIIAHSVDEIRYQLKCEKADAYRKYDVEPILRPADLSHQNR
jgi:hypothetical protein